MNGELGNMPNAKALKSSALSTTRGFESSSLRSKYPKLISVTLLSFHSPALNIELR